MASSPEVLKGSPETSKPHASEPNWPVEASINRSKSRYGEKMANVLNKITGKEKHEKGESGKGAEKLHAEQAAGVPSVPAEDHEETEEKEAADPTIVDQALKAGLWTAPIALIPAHIAQIVKLGYGGEILSTLGVSALFAWLGMRALKKYPKSGAATGALFGATLGPSLLGHVGNFVVSSLDILQKGTWIPENAPLLAKIAPYIPALAFGGGGALGGAMLAGKLGFGKLGQYIGGTVGGTLGLSIFNASPVIVQKLVDLVPTALPLSSLVSTASLALVTASSAAVLYGLGRLEGLIWGRRRLGIVGTMGRGIQSIVTIPAAVAWFPPKYVLRKTKEFFGAQVAGAKRIVTGNSPAVKAVTSPIWWPIRTAYRAGRGLWRGLSNAVTGSQPSELDKKQGPIAKVARAVTVPIGKAIRAPYSFGKWLLSPIGSRSGNGH